MLKFLKKSQYNVEVFNITLTVLFAKTHIAKFAIKVYIPLGYFDTRCNKNAFLLKIFQRNGKNFMEYAFC